MSEQIAKWLEAAGLSVSAPFTSRGHAGSSRKLGFQLITGTDVGMPVERFQALYAQTMRLEKEVERIRTELEALKRGQGEPAIAQVISGDLDTATIRWLHVPVSDGGYLYCGPPAYDYEKIRFALRMMLEAWSVGTDHRGAVKLANEALDAPQPAAAIDERAEFERSANEARFFPRELSFAMTKSPSGREEYENPHLQSRWEGWQLRAKLNAQPVRVPEFLRKRLAQACERAERPVGMSVHDGQCRVQASDIRYLLRMLAAAPEQPKQEKPAQADGES